MAPRPSNRALLCVRSAAPWIAVGALVAVATMGGCPGQPALGPSAAPPAVASGSFPFKVSYRVGETWDSADDRIEIYEKKRYFHLEVKDAAGKVPPSPPEISVTAPAGAEVPQIFEVQADGVSQRYFVRIRFYDPGAGYKLNVKTASAGGATDLQSFVLPAIKASSQRVGDLGLEYTASPSLGRPSIPARITLRGMSADGQETQLSRVPTIRVVNPCGWGPSGTFSAVPDSAGRYEWEIPKDEVINVTGNYRLKVYAGANPNSFVEYLYETR